MEPNPRVTGQAVAYIEAHLTEKLTLAGVAEALHYSKYHLHRVFSRTVGLTLHDYTRRRQLTEAARRLTDTREPLIQVALAAGYDTQQAFTSAFKAMYKQPPSRFRDRGGFYPLQLAFSLGGEPVRPLASTEPIRPAVPADIPHWMALVPQVVDGFPHLDPGEYAGALARYIAAGRAFILVDGGLTAGAMLLGTDPGHIDFLAVHPLYRGADLHRRFIREAAHRTPRRVSITTYRAGDRADTGHRRLIRAMGFREAELLTEFGYPTQRFVLDW